MKPSKPGSNRLSSTVNQPTSTDAWHGIRRVVAVVWFVAFCIWFFSFGLPNNQPLFDRYFYGNAAVHPSARRWMAWEILPFSLLDLIDPPTEPNSAPWGLLYLTQRVPFVLIASFVWIAAICLGRLVLRMLRISAAFDPAERLFFAGCLGIASVSLLMLGSGLIGAMSRWPMLMVLAFAIGVEAWLTWRNPSSRTTSDSGANSQEAQRSGAWMTLSPGRIGWIVVAVATPFVFCTLLGSMSPQVDFDVIEYHLGGPKEWFLAGRISRLRHNVYTSFPFLTEMLLVTGMVLYGDWNWGAMSGQLILAGFVPLTAVGLFATGRRWFSPQAGWLAALVWLTTPWVYRISIIAYTEGALATYLFAAFALSLRLVWMDDESPVTTGDPSASGKSLRAADSTRSDSTRAALAMMCGLLGGCAMSCKYTGLVSVVVPVGALVVASAFRKSSQGQAWKQAIVVGSVFAAGVLVSVGPWLVKNLIETGNPVFPLGYAVFGGEGRDAIMNAQWQRAHSRQYPSFSAVLTDLPVKLTDVMANNDWHSALMFGLAPTALIASWRRKVWLIWSFIGWQFFSWFLLTHQIDRFYVPMFPVVALLAGCGGSWLVCSRSVCAWIGCLLIAANVLFNAWIMQQQAMTGFNAGRMDLHAARRIAVSPSLAWLNSEYASGRLPRETKILCVGEAALFHAQFPYVYNTVFDRSFFEMWFAQKTETGEFRLRPTAEIQETLRQHSITHVLVNWSEILRYREPGSYGYTDFAHPDRFAQLQTAGVLGQPLPLPDEASFVPVDESKRKRMADWAPSLAISVADRPGCRSVQVFPVQR